MKPGDALIDFSLSGVEDAPVSPADFSDKTALAVVFSCNHCPYVRAWESRMVEIQAQYADKGFQMIAINANDPLKYPSDNLDAMKERAVEIGMNFPYLVDETQDIARAYGAERTPEFFLFDQDRVLRYHGALDDNYEDPSSVSHTYLKDAIEALLEGRAPSTETTPPVGCTIKWK
ncbi:MAG: thioredoxin family protein [Chloroflexi bacterium]|nr:thioredoxin family protein [Chloroflexota bacterium]